MKNWKEICEVSGYEFITTDSTNVWFKFDGFTFKQHKGNFPPKKLNIKNCTTPEAWVVYLMHSKHKGLYGYEKFNWTGKVSDYATFVCPEHGEYTQIINGHLRGSKCFKCTGSEKLTDSVVVGRCIVARGNTYDYSKTKYTHQDNLINVICKRHGEFTTNFYAHLKGVDCMQCYLEKPSLSLSNSETFIKKAKLKHGDRYNYSKVNYISSHDVVTIGCKIHGDFEQVANYHLTGNGCQQCGLALTGFTRTSYINACKEGSNIYLLRLSYGGESFYKIGISKNVSNRVRGITCESPYSCDIVVSVFFKDAAHVYDMEKLLHKDYISVKYNPKYRFAGDSECFKEIDVKEFIKFISCVA